jgi:hypothetical protein
MNLGLPLVLVVLALAVVYFARHREVGARAGFLRWTGFGRPGGQPTGNGPAFAGPCG